MPTADDYPFPLIIFARMCTDKGAIQPMKLKLGAFRGVCDAKNVDISIPMQNSAPSASVLLAALALGGCNQTSGPTAPVATAVPQAQLRRTGRNCRMAPPAPRSLAIIKPFLTPMSVLEMSTGPSMIRSRRNWFLLPMPARQDMMAKRLP